MAFEPMYHIHLKSLRTFQERVGQSRVTKAAGDAIVAKMNAQYVGQVAYWLEPAWQEVNPTGTEVAMLKDVEQVLRDRTAPAASAPLSQDQVTS